MAVPEGYIPDFVVKRVLPGVSGAFSGWFVASSGAVSENRGVNIGSSHVEHIGRKLEGLPRRSEGHKLS